MVTGIWTPRGWSLSIWASGEPASPSSLHAGSPTQQCLMAAGTVRRPTAPGPQPLRVWSQHNHQTLFRFPHS